MRCEKCFKSCPLANQRQLHPDDRRLAMLFRFPFAGPIKKHVYPGRRRRESRRCHLEALENRLLPSFVISASNPRLPDPRIVAGLDTSWHFVRRDVPGAEAVSFDDSSWGVVDLPHTWNNLDGQTGSSYYRGVGWYRTHYPVSAGLAGKELFLKFDGACLVTHLYVNGAFVGEHRGGFAAFSWDVTPYLNVGDDNVLAVKVNNAPVSDVAPLSGDFTIDGGIYRHVYLIAADTLHISVTDDASPGVYLRQTSVSAVSADLQVITKLRNDGSAGRETAVVTQVLDAGGNVVTSLKSRQMLESGTGLDVIQDTTLDAPHLWDGRADPYQYHVRVQIVDEDSSQVVDQVEQSLGLRSYSVDPDNGFFLNGHYLDLHGVNFHQDRLDGGWAISDDDQREDVGLIQEIGATFVRLSHYQHHPLTYDLLDQAGIVAWSEIPFVNRATNSQAFFDNAKQQLREMIRQNYNHPAILFWGMYNEIGDDPVTRQLVGELVAVAHQEDPDRMTTAATSQADNATINYIPDVTGFNRYFGWYYGTTSDFGPWVDTVRRNHVDRALALSEYGAGASIYQHEENPRPPVPGGRWHPEEYQDLYHEALWPQLRARPFLWAKSVWNMFDFASANRHEGDTLGRNDKGLVTYDRQTRKDAFYWYKANWSADPVLYISSRRFVDRPSNQVEVKIYSNLDQVELTVNGVSLGMRAGADHIFRWTNVPLQPGANAITVAGTKTGTKYTDEVTWYAPDGRGGAPSGDSNVPSGIIPLLVGRDSAAALAGHLVTADSSQAARETQIRRTVPSYLARAVPANSEAPAGRRLVVDPAETHVRNMPTGPESIDDWVPVFDS
jgi:beta-galactosidase